MGRNAGRTENSVNHTERSSWLQGRGLSGRGHYAMVHRRDRWLQRVHQGNVLFCFFFSFFFCLSRNENIRYGKFFYARVFVFDDYNRN